MELHTLAPQRIAIIKPSALGDIMHSLPALRALRARFPQAHIAWVVNKAYEPLLKRDRDLDATLAFDRGAMKRSVLGGAREFFRFLSLLRQQRFDLAIDLQGLLRTGLMTRATGAAVRIGLTSAREGARWFYTHRIDDDAGQTHAVDRYCKVAETLGAANGPRRFELEAEPEAKSWSRAFLADLPRPWLAVGVGARWLTKRWPPEHFAEVLRRAQAEFGGAAIFVGAPEERDLALQTERLLAGRSVQLTGATTLTQLAGVLSECDMMLANDTGPLHLALALGKPVVAPFTCTQARRTGPYGPAHRAVESKVWCAGSCVSRCDRLECMHELNPDRLWPALREIMTTWQTHKLSA
jgi:lipopolysaccharide heptosyltransferase I